MEIKKYKEIFDDNNGVVKFSEFIEAGFHNMIMYNLINEGYVNKLKLDITNGCMIHPWLK